VRPGLRGVEDEGVSVCGVQAQDESCRAKKRDGPAEAEKFNGRGLFCDGEGGGKVSYGS